MSRLDLQNDRALAILDGTAAPIHKKTQVPAPMKVHRKKARSKKKTKKTEEGKQEGKQKKSKKKKKKKKKKLRPGLGLLAAAKEEDKFDHGATMETPVMIINVACELAMIGDEDLMSFLNDPDTQMEMIRLSLKMLKQSIKCAYERRNSPRNVRMMMVWRLAAALPRVLVAHGDIAMWLKLSVFAYDVLLESLLDYRYLNVRMMREKHIEAIKEGRRQTALLAQRHTLLQMTLHAFDRKNHHHHHHDHGDSEFHHHEPHARIGQSHAHIIHGKHTSLHPHRRLAWQNLHIKASEENEADFNEILRTEEANNRTLRGPENIPLDLVAAREELRLEKEARWQKLNSSFGTTTRLQRMATKWARE